MEESIFCGRRNLAAGRLDRMDFSDPRTWIELSNWRTNFSPILQKYAPRKASPYNLKISIFFLHYSSVQISSQKSASKSRRKKNLSTKSNAQLLGIKFRCALMRPSRASLAHATVNLISLHWVCCFNWLYIFQLLGGFICKIRVSCHICLLEFFNCF